MALNLEIGKTYVTKDGLKFLIQKRVADPRRIRRPYAFRGVTRADPGHKYFNNDHHFLFRADGTHGPEGTSDEFDLVAEYKDTRYLLPIDSVEVGDVVGDMHLHIPQSGPFKDWTVEAPFEITQDLFQVMLSKLPLRGNLLQNKMAQLVSVTEDVNGNISAALVIYRYDFTYHCATLFRPGLLDALR